MGATTRKEAQADPPSARTFSRFPRAPQGSPDPVGFPPGTAPPYQPVLPVARSPTDLQATSSPKDSSSSRPKLRTSSSRIRRSDRQMLDFTVPTLMSRISAISGSVRPS